ncbi:hypothetical protein GCM10009775_32600 [Microbacterium aoyamense]|uniref:Uncharacterized protein n=1 Tax=Microbacterium aoyamense TaxID=344166 RepID=A0ABP5B9Q8_9MICO|nr:hypothetical protein [Microbacterium aoyamense]
MAFIFFVAIVGLVGAIATIAAMGGDPSSPIPTVMDYDTRRPLP